MTQLFQKYKLYGKMNCNQNLLPETHYIDLNFYDLDEFDFALSISKCPDGTIFFENYEDNVLLADSGGNFFYIKRDSLDQNKKIDFIKIDTNFKFDNERGQLEIYMFIKIKFMFLQ